MWVVLQVVLVFDEELYVGVVWIEVECCEFLVELVVVVVFDVVVLVVELFG